MDVHLRTTIGSLLTPGYSGQHTVARRCGRMLMIERGTGKDITIMSFLKAAIPSETSPRTPIITGHRMLKWCRLTPGLRNSRPLTRQKTKNAEKKPHKSSSARFAGPLHTTPQFFFSAHATVYLRGRNVRMKNRQRWNHTHLTPVWNFERNGNRDAKVLRVREAHDNPRPLKSFLLGHSLKQAES